MIYKYDVSIAKNYLNEKELKNLTNLFLDYAEEEQIMKMEDWINETDKLLKLRNIKRFWQNIA